MKKSYRGPQDSAFCFKNDREGFEEPLGTLQISLVYIPAMASISTRAQEAQWNWRGHSWRVGARISPVNPKE
ncbi:hypothetical protein KSP40_PGU015566 [Platanthera guangdongensis]|uniref:Uncharacterized protein n=1 Tax=Platanthera guangdongensis TaxID=2320717 RepID=A0ABR2N361_9ASPA